MAKEVAILLADRHAKRIREEIEVGRFASASDVVPAALDDWLRRQDVRHLWQQGIDSGLAASNLTATDIKAQARARRERQRQQ